MSDDQRHLEESDSLRAAMISLRNMVVEAVAGCLALLIISFALLVTTFAIDWMSQQIPATGKIHHILSAMGDAATIVTAASFVSGVAAISLGLLRRLLTQFGFWPPNGGSIK